jgi:2-polyprenyl-3-methyl-5-hydroxy-6-metoxy-1,4-benzoquinol methylase
MKQQEEKLLSLLEAEIDPAFKQRAQFIFKQILKYRPISVLDIGCGRGYYTNALANLSFVKKIVGLESEQKNLYIAEQNKPNQKVEYIKKDFYQWQTPQKFDIIILSEVLEHLADEEFVLKKIFALLKADGKLLISVPHLKFPFCWDPLNYFLMKQGTHVRSDWWWLAGIWADHKRLYKKDQLIALLNKQGFKKVAIKETISFCWPFSHFILYGIGKNLTLKISFLPFNRFSHRSGFLTQLLAKFFLFPDKFFSKFIDRQRFVGLVGVFKKRKHPFI